jgi:hypothetical protein
MVSNFGGKVGLARASAEILRGESWASARTPLPQDDSAAWENALLLIGVG